MADSAYSRQPARIDHVLPWSQYRICSGRRLRKSRLPTTIHLNLVHDLQLYDNSPRNYGDTVSGWWVALNRWNPFSSTRNIPDITDIQGRLA
jgi:hypothetical protein